MPDRYAVENVSYGNGIHKALYRRDIREKGNRSLTIRGLQKQRSDLEHVDHPHDHVYLDGACKGPYYDKKRGIFSLDHHDDCLRQITLSTCMQAVNLARTRIITATGNTILGNDPDADTRFAQWALLNADIVAHDDRIFRRVQPLMIVEGNIDSLGLGYEELTGLSGEVVADARRRLNWLLLEERDLKARGRWETIDFTDFTENAMRKFDEFAFYRDALDTPVVMVASEKAPLQNGQHVHFTQAADAGIYEVEYTLLNHMKETDCACIIFHDGRSKWTIKLTGFVNDFDLADLWTELNEEELRMKQRQGVVDEKLLKAQWGGGNIIGGPPRYYNGMGTFIPKHRIIEIVTAALNKQLTPRRTQS
jgi:uncharacterized protein (UPF0248 family)